MNRIKIFRILLIIETIFLLISSFIPYSSPLDPIFFFPRPGDIEHSIAYFIYGFLICGSFNLKRRILYSGIIGGLFGILNEVIQSFVPKIL